MKQATIGDNSGVSGERLKAYISRIEKMEDEISLANEAKKDVYAEIKSAGYDTKIIRKIIAMRKKPDQQRREEEEITALYLSAIGDQLAMEV